MQKKIKLYIYIGILRFWYSPDKREGRVKAWLYPSIVMTESQHVCAHTQSPTPTHTYAHACTQINLENYEILGGWRNSLVESTWTRGGLHTATLCSELPASPVPGDLVPVF